MNYKDYKPNMNDKNKYVLNKAAKNSLNFDIDNKLLDKLYNDLKRDNPPLNLIDKKINSKNNDKSLFFNFLNKRTFIEKRTSQSNSNIDSLTNLAGKLSKLETLVKNQRYEIQEKV